MKEPLKTGAESTTSSTSDTLMDELVKLTEAASQAQTIADTLRGMAEAKKRQIEQHDQLRLNLGDD